MRKLFLITVFCLFTVQAYAKNPMQAVRVRSATDFIRMGHDEQWDLVKLLIKYGADIHTKDDKGKTVFGNITRHSKAENIKYLFLLGIKMTKADEISLFSCVEYDLLDVLQVFIENGANINAINADGCSLLEYAKNLERVHICEYLQKQHKSMKSLDYKDDMNMCLALTVPDNMYKAKIK